MILMIDNYDSFTYNLYQFFGELGEEVVVKRNDQVTIKEIESINPEAIIISPGPCTPLEAGISKEVVSYFKGRKPILGICLGQQVIAAVFGAKIVKALKPVHGKVEEIRHKQQGVFKGLKNPLKVTRYHSLVVEAKSLPKEIEITAYSKQEEIMALRHRNYLIEGVQFHPEAVLTEQGHKLLENFILEAKGVTKR